MLLEEFIKETLVGIVNGTKNANKVINKDGGDSGFWIRPDKDGEINFNVAVAVSETKKTTGGGGINIYSLKLGGEKGSSNVEENVSRIKFKISPRKFMA